MLSAFRGLDLTDEKAFLCGKILADLGADVIKIEKPGGDPSRPQGPFLHGSSLSEDNFFWLAYNANKRGITLDIETYEGQQIVKKLIRKVDFVIESSPPGFMDRLGLGYKELSDINPRIVLTSISSFGQNGPYRDFKGCDLIIQAMGGLMSCTGYPDRAPVRVGLKFAYPLNDAHAAMGTLVALYYRGISGEGQWVDCSAQASMTSTATLWMGYWIGEGILFQRVGPHRAGLSAGATQRQTWPCKDGYIVFTVMGGKAGFQSNLALLEWLEEESMADDSLRTIVELTYDMSQITQEMHDRMDDAFGKFFMKYAKMELYAGSVKRRILLYPAYTTREILQDEQTKARGFWKEIEYPGLGRITYPGGFVRASESEVGSQRRPPLIGEHNNEIYGKELQMSAEEILTLKQAKII